MGKENLIFTIPVFFTLIQAHKTIYAKLNSSQKTPKLYLMKKKTEKTKVSESIHIKITSNIQMWNHKLLTGMIWKCFIFCAWLIDSTKVLGLLWLSRTKKTLKKEKEFQCVSTFTFGFHRNTACDETRKYTHKCGHFSPAAYSMMGLSNTVNNMV